MRRMFAAWLALTYVCASAASAAGFAGCVHGAHRDGSHAVHGADADHAHDHAQDHAAPTAARSSHEPCAGPHGADARDQASGDEDSTHSCGCLGDCSMGAASAEGPRCEPLVPVATLDRGPLVATAGAAVVPAGEYVLPYPNAPPLS